MPLFFFNYTSGGVTSVDDMGSEFASLEAAYLDACASALAIAFEKLRTRQDPTNDAFEIVDNNRNVLIKLPFSEVLRPGAATGVAPDRRPTAMAMDKCRREMERGQKLKDELRAEIARTRAMFSTIRGAYSRNTPFVQH